MELIISLIILILLVVPVYIVSQLLFIILSALADYPVPACYPTLLIASVGAAIGNYRVFKRVKQANRGVFTSAVIVIIALITAYSLSKAIPQQVTRLYQTGIKAMGNQEWEVARSQFTWLIRLYPNYERTAYSDADELLAEAYFQLAREAVEQEKWQDAWDLLVHLQNTNENKFNEHIVEIVGLATDVITNGGLSRGEGLNFVVSGYQSDEKVGAPTNLRMVLTRMTLYADGSLRLDLNMEIISPAVVEQVNPLCLFRCTITVEKPDSVYISPHWLKKVIPANSFGGFFAGGQGEVSGHYLRDLEIKGRYGTIVSGFITFNDVIASKASRYCFGFNYGRYFEISNICFPLDKQEVVSIAEATPTPSVKPTPTSRSTIIRLDEPILANNKANIALSFKVVGFEITQETLAIKFSLERTIDRVLNWHSDRPRSDNIYLETLDGKYKVIEMRGIFDSNIEMMPGRTYSGELVFEKPDTESFILVYPDIEPLEIQLDALK
ncbi:MAG: hypothetical protein N2235_20160 [Fischerella sp.]|nr:hypothetical protein [Fischerella sp.]